MKSPILLMAVVTLMALQLNAQTGCPGCQINLPPLPEDTLYLPGFPNGVRSQLYDAQVSFRMPKSTTPVAAIDSVTPPGLPINKIEILGIDGLPPGLAWEPNQLVYDVTAQTDGCIRICGTPLEADTFILTVRLKATVFIITQETSFPIQLVIESPTSTGGFSMSNTTGCGSTLVSFVNDLPSNGKAGFSYQWDFGDGTSFLGENPAPHSYNTPGIYTVDYTAVIDTFGHTLTQIRILNASCDDELGLGKPDVYALIKDPNGVEVFNSSPHIQNVSFPLTLPVNTKIGAGNYTLEVWDEDSGGQGGDDLCGAVSFNVLSNGTLVSGGFSVELSLVHPVDTVRGIGTVEVFPNPPVPLVVAPNGLLACDNTGPVLLTTAGGAYSIQWFKDNLAIAGAANDTLNATANGNYQVQVSTAQGCTALSMPNAVVFTPAPPVPVFGNQSNLLYVLDTISIASGYGVQWVYNHEFIIGATNFTYCAENRPGVYTLYIVDYATSCNNKYEVEVAVVADVYCYPRPIPTEFKLYPNPAPNQVTIELSEAPAAAMTVEVWDIAGRLVQEKKVAPGERIFQLGDKDWPNGIYVLRLEDKGERVVRRFCISD